MVDLNPYPDAPQWPTDFGGCRVRGQYVTTNGQPLAGGRITFTPVIRAVTSTGPAAVIGVPRRVDLDSTGSFDVIIPASDDPDITPTGWTYKVEYAFPGISNLPPFYIEAPLNGDVSLPHAQPDNLSSGTTTPRGNLLYGNRAAISTDGSIGDFWIDTLNKTIAGPKESGGWPAPTGFATSDIVRQVTRTASGVLNLGEAGTAIDVNSASPVTLTVPTDGGVNFPVGALIEIHQLGIGTVTIDGPGVLIRTPSGNRTRAQYSTIGLRKRGANDWVLSGDLA